MKIAYYTTMKTFYISMNKAEVESLGDLGPYVAKPPIRNGKLCLERDTTGSTIRRQSNGSFRLCPFVKGFTGLEPFGLTRCEYQLATSFKGFIITMPEVKNEIGKFERYRPSPKPKTNGSIAELLRQLHLAVKNENAVIEIEDGIPVVYKPARQRISVDGNVSYV